MVLPDYCRKLKDGLYFDPWNPWCGFIRCEDHVASRQVCADGTWMGLNNALRVKFNFPHFSRSFVSHDVMIPECVAIDLYSKYSHLKTS